MDDLNACFRRLPEDLKVLVLFHIDEIEPPHILSLSLDVGEAFSLLRACQRSSYFEGEPDEFADNFVGLLDDCRVRSLEKERAMELIGDDKDRLCEYACERNFEMLKWAHNELELPWAPYPAGRVSDDILVLRVLHAILPGRVFPREDSGPEEWSGVKMVDGRVTELDLGGGFLRGGDCLGEVPAEVGHLDALRKLILGSNNLMSVPAEIWQLTSLEELYLGDNELRNVPAEIGQLTSLRVLILSNNCLTSVPAEIGQLTSLEVLGLSDNQLTSVPAEIGQLTSLEVLLLGHNQLTSVPTEIWQLTSLKKLWLHENQLTSVPAEIGQLTALRELRLDGNRLTSLPAEIWQLTSLERLWLHGNRLKSVPAAISELRAAGCYWQLDDGVTVDE